MIEPWRKGATALAEDIRRGRISCRDAVEGVLSRIDEVNGWLNAISVVDRERAVLAAEQADQLLKREEPVGPLHGVPFTVKEAIDMQGLATTDGLPAYRSRVAPADSPIVKNLRSAGAIPIGKTNMSEGAVRWHTESSLYGSTKNPWDDRKTAGGSCGGSAVAVAVGMGPLSVGNDIGGSLRWPAQCCGVASIKPSQGRVASASTTRESEPTPFQVLFSADGLMAREVDDLRVALHAASGPDSRDPWWVPVGPISRRLKDNRIRVALTVTGCGPRVDANIANGIFEAANALAAAGVAVDEVDPPQITEMSRLWRLSMVSQRARPPFSSAMASFSDKTLRYLELQRMTDPKVDLYSFVEAFQQRNSCLREWTEFLERYPIVLGPVSTNPPFSVDDDLVDAEFVAALFESHRLTLAANVLGLPAVVVPVTSTDGLPRVAQIIGRKYREDLCLDAAEIIERFVGRPTAITPRKRH